MSNIDLLTTEETAIAAAQGWLLCRVFDGPVNALRILPIKFEHPLPHAVAATQHVSRLARQGNVIAVKAMTAIVRDQMVGAAAAATTRKKKTA